MIEFLDDYKLIKYVKCVLKSYLRSLIDILKNHLLLSISLLLWATTVFSQDTIPSKVKTFVTDNVHLSGGFGGMGTYYLSSGVDAQRDPLFWQVNANINLKVGQVSFPFSAVMNAQNRSFTQPFNQYGLSPKYKAVTVHLGYRSLRFSDYSLSGNQFLGAGVEISPKKGIVRGKFLYGRFSKAVDGYYTEGKVVGEPSFERWGYGGQIEIGKPKNNVSLILFRAKDDVNSIVNFADDATIKPGENLIIGVTTSQKIGKKVTFKGEVDWSAYTRDKRLEESVLEGYTYINNIAPLFNANASSSLNKAMKFNLDYNEKKFKIGVGYRRVDPEYQTMGSVYLNNDFQDIQGKTSFRMLKNKIVLSGAVGLQNNNLDNNKVTEMSRLISSININYNINEQWMFNCTYSNFNSESHMTIVNTQDTMQYAQVTKNGNIQIMYAKATKKLRIASALGGNYQNAKVNGEDNSTLYNGSLSTQFGFLKSGLNITVAVNSSTNITADYQVMTLGPSLVLGKRFLNGKIMTSLSGVGLKTYIDGVSDGFIINSKIRGVYRVNRHHSLNLNCSFIEKNSTVTNSQEMITSLGYNYTF